MTPPPGDGETMPEPPAPTIAESLANSDNQFTPLTAAQRAMRTNGSATIGPADDFSVTAISGDGTGGFHVTFVRGGVETMLHFEDSDRSDCDGCFSVETDDGGDFWFWSQHSQDVVQGSEPGHRFYDEIDAGFSVSGERHRYMLVYGHQTETADLPAGAALYTGWMYTRSQLKDNRDPSGRLDIDGTVRLIADFDASTLEGNVSGIRFRRYDQDDTRNPWEAIPTTNRFEFGNGRITGGQLMAKLTAKLTGMDSGNNALDDTVQGI